VFKASGKHHVLAINPSKIVTVDDLWMRERGYSPLQLRHRGKRVDLTDHSFGVPARQVLKVCA